MIIPLLLECLSGTLWEIIEWKSIIDTLIEHKESLSDRISSRLFPGKPGSHDYLLKLFLSVEIAIKSSHAIVTYSSNVGRFIGLLHQHVLEHVTSIDDPVWHLS